LVFPRWHVFPRNQADRLKTCPTEIQGNAPFRHFWKSFLYKPFTGRYGSGSDETQPVKQHSQGGALGMELLTCPAAVHYRLLVAK
jgi:hypothetical protein